MLTDKITTAAFIISLIVHFLLLAIPQFNLNSSKVSKVMRVEEIMVDLEMEKKSILPKPVSKHNQVKPVHELRPKELVMEEFYEEPSEKEVNKDITEKEVEVTNSVQEAMLLYQDMLRRRIEENKEYPILARREGIEGIVQVRFLILCDGQVNKIEVVKSSGYKILDESAVATVKKSSPFPPIPKELNLPSVWIELSICYVLK